MDIVTPTIPMYELVGLPCPLFCSNQQESEGGAIDKKHQLVSRQRCYLYRGKQKLPTHLSVVQVRPIVAEVWVYIKG